MSSISYMRQSGLFALVSYVPDPLGAFLSELRQSLPGDENPQPHITILPPRPLLLPVEDAWLEAKTKLDGRLEFEVELGQVQLFAVTNILYLALAEGAQELQAMHDRLNEGPLWHDERFEYSPHVTLSGASEGNLDNELKKAEAIWNGSSLSRRFSISDVTFLFQRDDPDNKKWQRLWSCRLASPPLKAAGAATLKS